MGRKEGNICFFSLYQNRGSWDEAVSWSEREHRCSDFQKSCFTLQAESRHPAPTLHSSHNLVPAAPI